MNSRTVANLASFEQSGSARAGVCPSPASALECEEVTIRPGALRRHPIALLDQHRRGALDELRQFSVFRLPLHDPNGVSQCADQHDHAPRAGAPGQAPPSIQQDADHDGSRKKEERNGVDLHTAGCIRDENAGVGPGERLS